MRKNNKAKIYKFKISPLVYGVLVIIIVLSGLGFFLAKIVCTTDYFRVKSVKSNISLPADLEKKIKHQSLITLNIQKIYQGIKKQNPEYRDINVVKEFPSSLRIEANKREPFAQIKGKYFYLVDIHGVVLSAGNVQQLNDLVMIKLDDYSRDLVKGEVIADIRLKNALSLLEVLVKNKSVGKLAVKEINATYLQTLYFIAGEDVKIIVGKNDYPRKIFILSNIIEKQLKNSLAGARYIDLRYKKVYIGFKN